MTSIESTQPKKYLGEDISPKVRGILEGPPSSNYMHRQIQLAYDKARREKPGIIFDTTSLHQLMANWAESKLSEGFRLIANSSNFKNHSRFCGNIANITLEDVEYAIENNTVPEV